MCSSVFQWEKGLVTIAEHPRSLQRENLGLWLVIHAEGFAMMLTWETNPGSRAQENANSYQYSSPPGPEEETEGTL
jgi:hypothetical protein